jgi:hypothetical protein
MFLMLEPVTNIYTTSTTNFHTPYAMFSYFQFEFNVLY